MSGNERIMRLPAVQRRVGLSRSQLYVLIGRGEFPAPVKLGARAVGWLESSVDAWIEARKTDSPSA